MLNDSRGIVLLLKYEVVCIFLILIYPWIFSIAHNIFL